MMRFDDAFSTNRSLTRAKPVLDKKETDKFSTLLFLPRTQHRIDEGGLRIRGYFKTTKEDLPLVTVITVVLNGEAYLEETIQSVLSQTYDNVEYIVIDGGSADRTLQIIMQYDNAIDYWVSERDTGVYDAMNKGLSLSTGSIIGFINADDRYEPDAINKTVEKLRMSDADYSVGNIRKYPSKMIVKPLFPLIERKIYQEMMYPHPSAFIKRDVYKKVGLLETRYKIAADFEMALRIHINNFRSVYVGSVIALFRGGGVSRKPLSIIERLDIVLRYGKNPFAAYISCSIQLSKFYILRWLPVSLSAALLRLGKSRFQYED